MKDKYLEPISIRLKKKDMDLLLTINHIYSKQNKNISFSKIIRTGLRKYWIWWLKKNGENESNQ